MRQSSKTQILSIVKDQIDRAARSLVTDLSNINQSTGLQSHAAGDGSSHFNRWRQGMTWRNGFQDNPNEMLAAVESYTRHLTQKVKEVRDLQVTHDELKALPVEGA